MYIITLARPFGAGGHTLGERLAKRLSFSLVEEEMVNAIAEKAKVSPEWVKSVEAERGGFLMNFINSLVSPSFFERLTDDSKGYLDENIYVDILGSVMQEIARESNAVIVGRGGQYFLREHPDAVHVLLTADEKHRVQFLAQKYQITEDKARQVVERGDKRRDNFYRKLKSKDFDDPSLYHLVLNMSRVTLDEAEDAICSLIQGRMAKKGR
ncbi:MAG: cytidylate kinase-like family protein [Thermodesulfobacteriota bacterium]